MELGGPWLAEQSDDELRRRMAHPSFDDSGWSEVGVPGHWRSEPRFAVSDGPLLYRRRFSCPAGEGSPARSFLVFDGIFYQGDVWLDGDYLGDTEGYFFPHSFEVTAALAARDDHLLAVEVACAPPADRKAKRNLTGVLQHWDCIDPSWNPGGIWAPVRIVGTGPVRIRSLKVLCREATPERAALDFEADLDAADTAGVAVRTEVRRKGRPEAVSTHDDEQQLAAGANRVRWRVTVERPELWWPAALGPQHLYDVSVEVRTGPAGERSDARSLTTGLRVIRIRDFVATVNGERMFLKGANCGPTKRALGECTQEDLERDVLLAKEAGLDLIRVHGHISRPELYEAADREGVLVWQDLPLQWGYGQVRRQATAQARQAVDLLGHHPCIALWCAHNEPLAIDAAPSGAVGAKAAARIAAGQALPSWNKTFLDRSIRRALERADGSREVVAHSGVVPHPAWGTDSHLYFGWYHGQERDLPGALRRFPVLARFVSEFGAQAVPDSDRFMHPERWPDLDWDHLEGHHCLQRSIFAKRVPPQRYPSFDAWRKATQDYQATLLRYHVEAIRRLKYRPAGGFCAFMLADAQPAVSWSVLDHDRKPKLGYWALKGACTPVIITADRPARGYRPGDRLALDIHAVSDLRVPLAGAVAEGVLRWPGGERSWGFAGDVPPDSCVRIGRIVHTVAPGTPSGDLSVELTLRWPGGSTTNSYMSGVL